MLYIKRGIPIVIFLLLASVALGAHSASISADYIPVYETTNTNISVEVSNSLFSSASINEVTLLLDNFDILSVVDMGWDSDVSNSTAVFSTSKDRIGRWGSQIFGLAIKAGNVNENQSVMWEITTRDNAGDLEVNTLNVIILNDYSAPVISNVLPENGSFVRQGTADQEFSFTAVDEETGILNVNGIYGICGNLSNTLSFTQNGDDYSTSEDLSGYADESVLCYEYSAQNNGGETATVNGRFTIDGSAPHIELVFPEEGALMNNNSLFQFTATDNLAPVITCSIYVDGEETDTVNATSSDITGISVENIPEGDHEWYVSCTDLAGNQGSSETRAFSLDKTLPVINVTSPLSGSVNKAGVPVEVEVTDNYGVTQIWYEFQDETYSNLTSPFSINTENATDGPNLITIYATDEAGNEAVLDYLMIVDREGPTIDLISPVDNGTFDYHVHFLSTVTDNYDPLLDCEVIVDGSVAGSFQAENGNMTDEMIMLDLGTNKSVSVQCTDDAENPAFQNMTINIVDLTGPDISLQDIGTIVRGESVNINATVTDLSGIDSVNAIISLANGTAVTVSLSNNGNTYTGEYPTTTSSPLGNYSLDITANDTNGYDSTAMDNFEVVNGYIITLDITSPVTEGDQVTVSGTAQRDDEAPVDEIIAVLPSGNRTLPVSNGSYSTVFNSPAPGTYEIMAYLSANNRTFSETKTLEVRARASSDGSSSSGGSSGGGRGKHSTVAMPLDVEEEEPEESQPQEIVGKHATEPKLEPSPAEPREDPNSAVNTSEQPGNGIGRAGGFLNLENIKWSSLLWVVLAILAVALLIKLLASKGGRKRRKRNDFDLDRYLASRRR